MAAPIPLSGKELPDTEPITEQLLYQHFIAHGKLGPASIAGEIATMLGELLVNTLGELRSAPKDIWKAINKQPAVVAALRLSFVIPDQRGEMIKAIRLLTEEVAYLKYNFGVKNSRVVLMMHRYRNYVSLDNFWLLRDRASSSSRSEVAREEKQKKQREYAELTEEVLKHHGVQNRECMVTGLSRDCSTSHIIPKSATNMQALAELELTPNDINTPRNCLFMLSAIEDAFDSMELCILYNPLTLLNKTELKGKVRTRINKVMVEYDVTWEQIDMKPLKNQGGGIFLRGISRHAYHAYENAKHEGWITEEEYNEFKDFSQCSPTKHDVVPLTKQFLRPPSPPPLPLPIHLPLSPSLPKNKNKKKKNKKKTQSKYPSCIEGKLCY